MNQALYAHMNNNNNNKRFNLEGKKKKNKLNQNSKILPKYTRDIKNLQPVENMK
jgi:hypothetical protein